MMVIRPVVEKDLDQVYALAASASEGLTTLPVSRERLTARIKGSEAAFQKKIKKPGNEYYFLVLEDLEKKKLAGTTGIFGAVGLDRPFYNFRIGMERHTSDEPAVKTETRILKFGTPYKGTTELATLYLHFDYRGGGNGVLLSKSRYLLMAAYPKRFAEVAMAEIRGWVDDRNFSPFWEAVGRHFFRMDLVTADRINSMGNWQFIRDLMPRHPLYVETLPKEAREVIAKPHEESAGALSLLESEGLKYKNVVDIFDAGPCVEAPVKNIRAVKESQPAKVDICGEGDGTGRFMVANQGLENFRVVQGPVLEGKKGKIGITGNMAEALRVRKGDTVRYVTLKRKK